LRVGLEQTFGGLTVATVASHLLLLLRLLLVIKYQCLLFLLLFFSLLLALLLLSLWLREADGDEETRAVDKFDGQLDDLDYGVDCECTPIRASIKVQNVDGTLGRIQREVECLQEDEEDQAPDDGRQSLLDSVNDLLVIDIGNGLVHLDQFKDHDVANGENEYRQ